MKNTKLECDLIKDENAELKKKVNIADIKSTYIF